MRSWSISLFRVFGIRIELHATFVLLLILFGMIGWEESGASGALVRIAFGVAVFACVLLHELGHSLTAMQFNVAVERIMLLPIGGVAQFQSMPKEPVRELLITAAGPAVNFVLAALLYAGLALGGLPFRLTGEVPLADVGQFLSWLLAVNLAMGIFNLLPIFPMDGGRLLRALLALRFTYLGATRFAAGAGKILSAGMIVFVLVNPSIPLFNSVLLAVLFAFILIGGHMEYEMVKSSDLNERCSGLRVFDVMESPPPILADTNTVYSALKLLEQYNAAEGIVNRGPVALGVVTAADLTQQVDTRPNEPIPQALSYTPRLLHGDWPLDLFIQNILAEEAPILPVYVDGAVGGVVRPGKLPSRLQTRRSTPPPLPPDSRT